MSVPIVCSAKSLLSELTPAVSFLAIVKNLLILSLESRMSPTPPETSCRTRRKAA
jgi:hypothetical protein